MSVRSCFIAATPLPSNPHRPPPLHPPSRRVRHRTPRRTAHRTPHAVQSLSTTNTPPSRRRRPSAPSLSPLAALRPLALAALAALLTTLPPRRASAQPPSPAASPPHQQQQQQQQQRVHASAHARVTSSALRVKRACAHDAGDTSFGVAGSAALLASTVAVSLTHPIDTLKTLRQARSARRAAQRQLSVRTLYRGVLSNVAKEAPNAAIYLGCYALFKRALLATPGVGAVPLAAMCVAGMLGDAVGSVVRVPAEMVNKRLQLGLSDSWTDAIRDMFLSAGAWQGTLNAWVAVLCRDVPYGGLQIAAYEGGSALLGALGCAGLAGSVVAGAGAGLVAAVLTTPMDVLVTRLSVAHPQCDVRTRRYVGCMGTLRRVVREEGLGVLWNGALCRGLLYMPMMGVFFAAYELFKVAIARPAVLRDAALRGGAWAVRAVGAAIGGGGGWAVALNVALLTALLVCGWRAFSARARDAVRN